MAHVRYVHSYTCANVYTYICDMCNKIVLIKALARARPNEVTEIENYNKQNQTGEMRLYLSLCIYFNLRLVTFFSWCKSNFLDCHIVFAAIAGILKFLAGTNADSCCKWVLYNFISSEIHMGNAYSANANKKYSNRIRQLIILFCFGFCLLFVCFFTLYFRTTCNLHCFWNGRIVLHNIARTSLNMNASIKNFYYSDIFLSII